MNKKSAKKRQMSSYWFYILAGVFAVLLGGCRDVSKRALPICPGKESALEALGALQGRRQRAGPFRANGQCRLQYYDGEGKESEENFPVKVWIEPPDKICLFGDVAFDARAIVLGANEREFWLAARPKEVSGYWWGGWRRENEQVQRACSTRMALPLSPQSLLEALGLIEADAQQWGTYNWQLSNRGAFDILTSRDNSGEVVKKIYISCCDYLVRKIEYFAKGQVAAVMELDEYKAVSEDFWVPRTIRIVRPLEDDKTDSVKITLSSAKAKKFSQKQRDLLFHRPVPKRFEHVYRLNEDCEFVEQ